MLDCKNCSSLLKKFNLIYHSAIILQKLVYTYRSFVPSPYRASETQVKILLCPSVVLAKEGFVRYYTFCILKAEGYRLFQYYFSSHSELDMHAYLYIHLESVGLVSSQKSYVINSR